MYKLSKEQVNHFHQNGWIGPLDTFSAEEVETTRKELEKISKIEQLADQQLRTFSNAYLGMSTALNLHFEIDSFSRLWQDERIANRLNQLGEENLLLWRTTVWHRMPRQKGIDWHQTFENYSYGNFKEADAELIFPENEDALNITVWMALDDIKAETGVLSFGNGTHHKKRFETHTVDGGEHAYQQGHKVSQPKQGDNFMTKAEQIDDSSWDVTDIQSIKAGQIVIFTERVMHKAPDNNSNMERWACNARYIRPSVKIHPQRFIDNYEYKCGWDLKKHFSILVSGEDNYGLNEVVPKYSRI